MSNQISAIVSQMKTWETTEIEDSFLSTCVYALESDPSSSDQLCHIVSIVEQDWFNGSHRKAIFYVVKKIVLSLTKSNLVVPGSISVMAQKLLFEMGYKDECALVDEVAASPSMFFNVECLEAVIPLWRVKLARNSLKGNAERMISLLAGEPDQKIFEEEIPSLIENQQEIWHNASNVDKKDDDWDSSIKTALLPLPTDIAISTGVKVLDDVIQGGVAKRNSPYSSRLIVIAGRPGMGKSAFAIFLATQLANYSGDIAFFSLEMPKVQVQYRSIACLDYLQLKEAGQLVDPIRIDNLRLRSYNTSQRERLSGYLEAKLVKRLHIFDKSVVGVDSISAKVKLLAKTRPNLTAVFIDYLQLIDGCSGDGQNSETSNIGNVTKSLKSLAVSIGIDIFLLCQVNRGVEMRNDRMPGLSDLRASGRIEEDADIVMFLLRPHYYDRDRDPYELAVSVAKNRHGICGTLACSIDLQSSVIFDNATQWT